MPNSGLSCIQPNLPVPYVQSVVLIPGSEINIHGIITGDAKISFTTGPNISDSDRQLHVTTRLSNKVFLFNTFFGDWGTQKKNKEDFNLNNGDEVHYNIKCTDKRFEIYLNKKLVQAFKYRGPLLAVTHCHVDGGIELKSVDLKDPV